MLLIVMLQDLTCNYAFVVIYFNKTREKMTLYFGYLQKDKKKILLVPQDCLLLNKYISFTSAQAFFYYGKV